MGCVKQLWVLPTISTSLFFLFKASTYFLKKPGIRNRTVEMMSIDIKHRRKKNLLMANEKWTASSGTIFSINFFALWPRVLISLFFFPNNTTQRFGICDYIHFNLIETLNKIKFNWIKILELFWKYFKEENQISMLWQETKGRWRLLVEGTAWNVDSNFNT